MQANPVPVSAAGSEAPASPAAPAPPPPASSLDIVQKLQSQSTPAPMHETEQAAPPHGPNPVAPLASALPKTEVLPPIQPTEQAAPASPAAQLAPALISSVRSLDGAQRLSLRLQPPELGHVEVKLERPADGPVHIEVTVQRPETLLLLLRDQPQLQHVLDQAGVPADGRVLTFHMAAPQAPGNSIATPAATTSGQFDPGSQHNPGSNAQQNAAAQENPATGDELSSSEPATVPRWLRAGLDITA